MTYNIDTRKVGIIDSSGSVQPFPTGGSGRAGSSYIVELSRWGIISGYTDTADAALSLANSNGINSALAWAASQGYTTVTMPKGNYLINETQPIWPQSYQTFDLAGSKFRIRDNALFGYNIVAFVHNQVNSRITNGIMQGDKYTHDYYLWNYAQTQAVAWTVWAPNKAYTVGQKVIPTGVVAGAVAAYFLVTTAGTSGATEPAWNITTNAFTSDGTVTWQASPRHTHEWGFGINVGDGLPPSDGGANIRFCTIDNIEFYDFTGDGIAVECTYGQTTFSNGNTIPIFESGGIYMGDNNQKIGLWKGNTTYSVASFVNNAGNVYKVITSGSLSTVAPTDTSGSNFSTGDGYTWQYRGTLGAFVTDVNKIRQPSTQKILMSNTLIAKWGYFGIFGGPYGDTGTEVTATLFDIAFYNSDDSYNSGIFNVQFFDKIDVPAGASYARIVLHQATIPTANATATAISLKVSEMPEFVYIQNNHVHDCRRLGMSIVGGRNIYMRENLIHHISGTGPAGAIDIEDGYRTNQNIFIERNRMYATNTGCSFVGGRNIQLRGNTTTDPMTVWNNVDKCLMDGNTYTGSAITLYGEVTFTNNRMFGCRVTVSNNGGSDRAVTMDSCQFLNTGITITKGTAYSFRLSNSEITVDSDHYLSNTSSEGGTSIITFGAVPQTFQNVHITGYGPKSGALTTVNSASVDPWMMDNVSFTDTKHPDNITTGLPPGIYTGCRFVRPGNLAVINTSNTTALYEFNGCRFTWDGYNLFGTPATQGSSTVKFDNCNFYATGNSICMYWYTFTGRLIMLNNTFDYPAAASTSNPILQLTANFAPTSVLIAGNVFKSNLALKVLDASNANLTSTSFIFRDNVLDTVTVVLQNTHIRMGNVINGAVDPHLRSTTANRPSSGLYAGYQYYDTTINKPIWYNGTAWTLWDGTVV